MVRLSDETLMGRLFHSLPIMGGLETRQNLDALRLARDLCAGISAFFVVADGDLIESTSPDAERPDTSGRVRSLAAQCLAHPKAHGQVPFTNAELATKGVSDDDLLACIASPVFDADRWVGLIGIADTWLPDLDEEQRAGLERIGGILARRLSDVDPEEVDVPRPPARVTEAADELASRRSIRSDVLDRATMLDRVAAALPEALLVCRPDGAVISVNPAFSQLADLGARDVIGLDVATLLTPDDGDSLLGPGEQTLTEHLLGAPSPGRRLHLVTRHGDRVPVDVTGHLTTVPTVGTCYVAIVRDGRALATGISATTIGEWSFETALDSLDEGVVICDSHGVVRFINFAARRLQGIEQHDDLVGHVFPVSTGLYTSDEQLLTRDQHPIARALRGIVVRSEHLRAGTDEAERRHILASAQPLPVGEGRGALLVLRDVTTQTVEQARLTHLALHDPLTGLANRNLLLDHLTRILGDTRSQGGIAALIFLDLDDFKAINDQNGHDVGDEVLIAFSRRLLGAVRSRDIVARLGGDEFVIAHTTSGDETELHQMVARIKKKLSVPYQIRGHNLVVGCSIGWVIADPATDDPLFLLARADHEMYRAKQGRLLESGEM